MREQINKLNYSINGTIYCYGILAKRWNLNYNSLMLLYIIDSTEKCTQKNICDILQLPKSTVHSILESFIKNDILTLKTDETNKKEKIIILTDNGEKYVKDIMNQVHDVENNTMKKLGNTMCKQLVESNMAFYEAFKEEVENG